MLASRIESFVELGNQIKAAIDRKDGEYEGLSKNQINLLLQTKKAGFKNGWFTSEMVNKALNGIVLMLNEADLKEWTSKYSVQIEAVKEAKEVGVIMAGNIPAVGFHDLLSVLISGHKVVAKTSSVDEHLMPAIVDLLVEIDGSFEGKVEILDSPRAKYDAVIATGSDNSARYFEQYFGKYPNIIRKSRTSVAVLTGDETPQQLEALAHDLFAYYGLGCRNVSKFLLLKDFDITPLMDELSKHDKPLVENGKYHNNVDYNKSIYLINSNPFLDGGTFMLKEDNNLQSPISVTFFERFESMEEIESYIELNKESIQCVVSNKIKDAVDFGEAQKPKVWDYADKIDTINFLVSL